MVIRKPSLKFHQDDPSQSFPQIDAQIANLEKHLNKVSLTLVTSFFETSKLWANIYYALVGLECLGQYRAFAGYRDPWEP